MAIGWAASLVVATLLTVPAGYDAFLLPKTVVLVIGAWLAISTWAVQGARARPQALRGLVLAVAAAFGGSVTAMSVLSPDPITSLTGHYGFHTGALLYLSLCAAALALAASVDPDDLRMPTTGLAGAAVCVALYCAIQWMGIDPFTWETGFSGTFATLGNPNYAGAYLGISAAAVWWWLARRRTDHWLRVVALVLLVLAILSTRSEQGFVAAVVSLSVPLVLHWRTGTALQRRAASAVAASVLVLVVIAGAALAGWGPASFVGERIGSLQRQAFWSASFSMAEAQPLTGVGFDLYGEHYRLHRPAAAAERVAAESTSSAAHSVPLNMLATGGLPTLLAYLCVLGLAAVGWYRLKDLDGPHRDVAFAWAGVWASYQAQSFVSVDVAPLAMVHWSSVAVLAVLITAHRPTSWLRRVEPAARRSAPFLAGGALIVMAVVVVGGLAYLLADLSAGRYQDAVAAQQPDQALAAASAASSTAPWVLRYDVLHAGALGLAEETSAARDGFSDVWARSGGTSADAALNAARASLVLDDADAVALWYDRFLLREPHQPALLLEAARAYAALGDEERAISVLRRLVDVQSVRREARELLREVTEAS